jgi:hypothetical protein
MIGLNFQTKSLLNASVFRAYTRVLHRALVNTANDYMGSQSVLFVARDVHDPLLTHGYRQVVYKGV